MADETTSEIAKSLALSIVRDMTVKLLGGPDEFDRLYEKLQQAQAKEEQRVKAAGDDRRITS